MTNLIIPRLTPNSTTRLQLQGEVFGEYGISPSFEVKSPPAVPLISYQTIGLKVEPGPPQYGANGSAQFKFSKFTKLEATRTGFYRLRLLVRDALGRGDLKKKEIARLVSNSSDLSSLNGRDFNILDSRVSLTGKTWVVDLEVSNNYQPGVTTGNVDQNNSYVREVTVRRERSNFTVTIPKDNVFNNLINFKKPSTGVADIAVRDIPIYAYKNWYKEDTSKLPKLSMYDDQEINEKTPPTYSSGIRDAFLAGNSYTKSAFTDKKPNFVFYVAIARYYLRNGQWTGEWLQINKSNKAIWGKARLDGK